MMKFFNWSKRGKLLILEVFPNDYIYCALFLNKQPDNNYTILHNTKQTINESDY